MEASIALWERFALGILQTGGTVGGGQNLLGLISHLIVFPFFALLLTGPGGWIVPITVLSGILLEVLTVSRATVALAGIGFVAVFTLSAFRKWTSRKAMVLMVGVLLIIVAAPLVISSFEQRKSQNDYASSDAERAAYVRAAETMLADHPFGVGANHFAVIANIDGYYLNAGVPPDFMSLAGHVHNSYLLVAAETGYFGLITLLLLLLRPLVVAFRCGWHHREDDRGDLLLGLGVGLLIIYVHSLFEWIFVTFQVQYLVAFAIGCVSGIAQQLGYWRQIAAPKSSLKAGSSLVDARSRALKSQDSSGDLPLFYPPRGIER